MKPSKETTAASTKKLRASIDSAGDTSRCPIRRTTLIVCRTPVLLKWQTQLNEHIEPDTLKVFTYHGLPRPYDIKVEDFKRYDIVLTTYTTLQGTIYSSAPALLNMEWYRVILDEAHVIKSVNHYNIWPAFRLKAKNKWLVTGMPIMRGAYDMHFPMAFLRFEPFSDKKTWRSLVQLPIHKGKENGLSRLQDIMATISLRRLNSDPLVGLPPKTIETCSVELSAEEREKYDQMEVDYQSVVRNYLHLGREVAHHTSIDGIVQRLRQMCNEAASCPSEPHRSYTIEDVSKNPELLRKMVSVLQDGDSFDCPICISPLVEPTITCCAHMFCKKCILKALLKKKPCCPLCRHHLSEADLFSASSDKPCNEDENNLSSGVIANCSSKVSTLLNLLVSSRNENHLAKSVVFSQFGNMLSLLTEPLKAAGFESLKLNGWMSSERRDDIIKIFKNSNSSMVLLVDLKALGSGVHLTKVSNTYLLEPWIDPATEEQVLNRVHGIVRKDVVKIVRLITRHSIEERILELHEKKKLGRLGKNMDRREARNEELGLLMAL
ncbi:putative SWI/SNF-related matrix-associated actin-dependent regulator of chromatin subfamily A member 3-like 1 [Papaver somniferum]|uniref:putative SWI/SNF-related matrix-associated actin-dependent regulator of chromatin subfamily A member 3-like 1 n=1 Tax=Papaver somniferum TaxID=3469 RepID=UPI000E70188F|nr:putative SWI/SNF-related matrix-associated actin-dependent regulator of chromatin subfamily A member 3-like 1 [Papaver somniferum]